MLINKVYKKNFLFYLVIITILMIGISIYKDYGFGADENINRKNGEISYNYIEKVISNIINHNQQQGDLSEARKLLDNYKDKDYGVAFDLPVMVIEKLLKLEDSQDQYLLRHALTHFIFLISLLYFYKLIFNRFKNVKLALIAVSFIYINPRLFAESFYNNKDIVFMSLFIIAMYYSMELLRKFNFNNCFLAGITTAVAIDVRIIGVMLPGVVLVGWLFEFLKYKEIRNESKKNIFLVFLYLTVLVIFTISLWPWLWTNPIDHFMEAFNNMANFRWINWVLYRGQYYVSTDLPWHYLPVWISLTTPVVYLMLAVYGYFALIKRTLLYKLSLFTDKSELIDLAVASIFIIPVFAAVILKSTIYDGWRQFYFLYSSLIYVSIFGLNSLFKSKFKFIIILVLSCQILSTCYWMIKNHPYQFVYFNIFSGKDVSRNFEMDYWGITNVDLLKKILRIDNSFNIKVYGLGHTSIPQSFLLLSSAEQERIRSTLEINNADYVVTNFRMLGNKEYESQLFKIKKNFTTMFEIKVDDNIIGSVFKRN